MDKRLFFFIIDEITSSFERADLINAANTFEEVVLITMSENNTHNLPDKIRIHKIDYLGYNNLNYLVKAIRFFAVFISEFFGTVKYLKNLYLFKYRIISFFRAIFVQEEIFRIVKLYDVETKKKILYSFWFNDSALALAIMNQKKKIKNAQYIGRAHGTDLFEERVPVIRRIAFRNFQIKWVDGVFSVSEKGSRYLKTKYPQWSNKIFTSYLGTMMAGTGSFNPAGKFTIVSCAKIRNIKRIHLIPGILSHIDFPLKWIHVGGADKGDPAFSLFQRNLEELKLANPNIEIKLAGELSNEDVLKMYGKDTINLFLSVSETEGLPVSMMEAISFGIPLMATDVGGCSEIVSPQTGILINAEFNSYEIAKKISQFRDSEMNTDTFRNGVKEFWKKKFNSEANFKKFIELIN